MGERRCLLKAKTHTCKGKLHAFQRKLSVYTQMTSNEKFLPPTPHFLFKGKGIRAKVEKPPPNVNIQWSESGSYRLENILELVETLPKIPQIFGIGKYRIYLLDDYSAHVHPDVKQALLKKGWILVAFGGGITGDLQVNDTSLHHPLKSVYRDKEEQALTTKLSQEDKIPCLSRNEIVNMLTDSYTEVTSRPGFQSQSYKCN